MIDPARSLSVRFIAIAALLLFAPIMISIITAPTAGWFRNYPGILFHLALFLLVAKLEAPEWAKAAGYGWLTLDVMAAVLTLNGVPPEIYVFVRLGGHLFGGVWIAVASLSGSLLVRIVGVITGVYLSGYTFVSPFVPLQALFPDAILILVWLGIIAWQNGSRRHPRVASPTGILVSNEGYSSPAAAHPISKSQ